MTKQFTVFLDIINETMWTT